MKAQDYDYPLKHIVIKKDNKVLVAEYGKKLVDKLAKAGVTLDAFVGASPKTCKKLQGLGSTLQSLSLNGKRVDLGLTQWSNHVWLPQLVNEDGEYRSISVCFNCGSVMDKGNFVDAQEEEKKQEEK